MNNVIELWAGCLPTEEATVTYSCRASYERDLIMLINDFHDRFLDLEEEYYGHNKRHTFYTE